jgi:hypothetical protein
MLYPKGGLLSGVVLTLVPLPTKSAKSLPLAENLKLPSFLEDNIFKFSAQGRDLAFFDGNGTKVKIPSGL